MFKAIIFDLDGTLIDSAQDVRYALNKVLMANECQKINAQDIYGYLKNGVHWLIQTAFLKSNKKINNKEIKKFANLYLAHYQKESIKRTILYPGVIDVLSSFKKQGIKLGVCTNKPSVMTNLVLEQLNLFYFFDAIVAAEDTALLKPHPEHIYETMIKMNIQLDTPVVMVGDSDSDIIAARNACIPVIAAKYGYSGTAIEKLKPDACIDEFFELPETLKNVFKYQNS